MAGRVRLMLRGARSPGWPGSAASDAIGSLASESRSFRTDTFRPSVTSKGLAPILSKSRSGCKSKVSGRRCYSFPKRPSNIPGHRMLVTWFLACQRHLLTHPSCQPTWYPAWRENTLHSYQMNRCVRQKLCLEVLMVSEFTVESGDIRERCVFLA